MLTWTQELSVGVKEIDFWSRVAGRSKIGDGGFVIVHSDIAIRIGTTASSAPAQCHPAVRNGSQSDTCPARICIRTRCKFPSHKASFGSVYYFNHSTAATPAVTSLLFLSKVTVHTGLVPLHATPHPVNVEPLSAVAVTVTLTPLG